jgi:hypothetical protein
MIRLTWREYLTLRSISFGHDRPSIMAITGFSEETAKRTARNLLDKFAVPNTNRKSQATYALAVRHGYEYGYLTTGDQPKYQPWPGMKEHPHGPACYRARRCHCDGTP